MYRIAGNFRELDEVEQFANKLSQIAEATPRMRMYVQKFADKTFAEGGYAVKFVKVSRYTVSLHIHILNNFGY